MEAKYYKIYASKFLKEVDKEMGFVKEIDNNLLVIYKNGTARLEYIENFTGYLKTFTIGRCTKKEFEKAFYEAIDFYTKRLI